MPEWTRDLRRRLAASGLSSSREAEIAEELAQHLDDRYAELRSRGADDRAARREALAELDDADLVRSLRHIETAPIEPVAIGGSSTDGLLAGLVQDVRFAARLLLKDFGAAAVIVTTLALAIAANAIVFAFADLLLFRPLPVGNASRIVTLYSVEKKAGQDRERLSIPAFQDVAARAASFDSIGGGMQRQMSLTGASEPRAVVVQLVTANLHELWRVDAAVGRTLRPGDGEADQRNVTVLSHRFWSAQFAADPAAVGRTIVLNGVSYTIVGVLAPAIELGNLAAIDLWLPLDTTRPARRDDRTLAAFALLKPAVTAAAASAEMEAIGERLGQEHPTTDGGRRLFAIPLRDSIAGGDTWIVLALLGVIVSLVLLVGCANVATVMLARASARRREIAVRSALGASRARLVRQLGVEGLLLGLASGAVGLLITVGGLAMFKAYSAEPFFQRLTINSNLLGFTLALSVLTPVLFCLLPTLQMSRPDLQEDLKDGGRSALSSARGNRSRSVLIVTQVAFALAVLIVSGLIVRTIVAMKRAPLGFSPTGVLTLRIRLDPPKYVDDGARVRMVEATLDRLMRLPGVAAVSAMASVPLVEGEPTHRFTIAGRPIPAPADIPWAVEATMLGDYVRTLEVRLLAGRLWTAADRQSSWRVAAVSREAARRYWPDRSPIGERILPVNAAGEPAGEPLEIVGLVDDVVGGDVDRPPPPRVYRPWPARPAESVAIAVRAAGDAASIAPLLRDELRRIDETLAVSEVRSLVAWSRQQMRSTELIVAMFVAFAGVGLLVAIAGIYGVTAFSLGQRRREIGVRLALGATASDVVGLLMAGTGRLLVLGLVLGLAAGWALAQTMTGILTNNVSAADPLTYAAVLGLLCASALVASYVPAHRVWSLDPAVVLRRE